MTRFCSLSSCTFYCCGILVYFKLLFLWGGVEMLGCVDVPIWVCQKSMLWLVIFYFASHIDHIYKILFYDCCLLCITLLTIFLRVSYLRVWMECNGTTEVGVTFHTDLFQFCSYLLLFN